jgi:hypothetical protein
MEALERLRLQLPAEAPPHRRPPPRRPRCPSRWRLPSRPRASRPPLASAALLPQPRPPEMPRGGCARWERAVPGRGRPPPRVRRRPAGLSCAAHRPVAPPDPGPAPRPGRPLPFPVCRPTSGRSCRRWPPTPSGQSCSRKPSRPCCSTASSSTCTGSAPPRSLRWGMPRRGPR